MTKRSARSAKQHENGGDEHAVALLQGMLRIRRFEEKAGELYQAGKIRGFLHLYIGEEAVAVGAMDALKSDDAIVATYRDHGHALARGIPAGALMAEMYGKESGCSRGRGGSMHFFDVERRFFGGYAIVAGGLPVAAGLALADKMRGDRRVTACFFGEGAVAEGEFHEVINMARLWQLPLLMLCENNRYAMGTALDRSESVTSVVRKAKSYDVPAVSVDGMDVEAVEAATRAAALAVRDGGGPQLLEFETYRFRGHSIADPELYRSKEEVELWKQRDPIATFLTRLSERGSTIDPKAIEAAVESEIADAVAFAEAAPWEPVEDLTRFVMSR